MTPEEFHTVLTDLNTVILGDLHKLWNEYKELDEQTFRDVIISAYPDLISPHIELAGELAADWYNDAAPGLAYTATTATLPPVRQLHASAGWALADAVNADAAFTLLAGSAQRSVFNGARQTIVDNAETERGARWARHARPTACRFCQMLATREHVYGSKELALKHSTGPKRRPTVAPARHRDDRYHDHCRCIAVMVRPGEKYSPPAYVDQWTHDYEHAVKLGGGERNFTAVMKGYRLLDKQATTHIVARDVIRQPILTKPAPIHIPSAEERMGLRRLPQKEPMRDSINKANPNYSLPDAEAQGWLTNCQRVICAYELRRRGWDVEAGRLTGDGLPLDRIAALWRDADGKPAQYNMVTSFTDMQAQVQALPVGARGFVYGAWKYGSGAHVWNWEVVQDKDGTPLMRWIEAQIPTNTPSAYIQRLDWLGKWPVQWARLDNLEPDPDAFRAEKILRQHQEGAP
ncbi:VG15 protein [Nocardia terpenica]|uniref:Uncharacterized protein n=1 Tax=Nocardia terpenica TaxID=455432 RepID=A0A291RTD8_9NOCA|nr:toxin glutamine deamidase domain-containing protein [Nocardia terpenica]ATL70773.1 hypothetical protein CRH09_35920 [Nocardia terpenica]